MCMPTCRARRTRSPWWRRPSRPTASLTVLYNNAGVMLDDDGSVDSTDESIWDTTLAINVKGVAHGCKYGIPAMIDSGGGSVINVASFVAWMGAATSQTAYTASKGAVLAMTREMAVEYARKGVRCNALCPGPIDTPLLAELLSDPGTAPTSVRPHPDGQARTGRGARQGRPVPRERRLQLHDGDVADRRRRDHSRVRDARGLRSRVPRRYDRRMVDLVATGHSWSGGGGPITLTPLAGLILTVGLARWLGLRFSPMMLGASLVMGTIFSHRRRRVGSHDGDRRLDRRRPRRRRPRPARARSSFGRNPSD